MSDYFVTNDYLTVVIRRPVLVLLYTLVPLGMLVLIAAYLLFNPQTLTPEAAFGAGVAFLLGIISIRGIVLPKEILEAGIFTLFDAVSVVAILMIFSAMCLALFPGVARKPSTQQEGKVTGDTRRKGDDDAAS